MKGRQHHGDQHDQPAAQKRKDYHRHRQAAFDEVAVSKPRPQSRERRESQPCPRERDCGDDAQTKPAGRSLPRYQTMLHPNGSVFLTATERPATTAATAFSRSRLVILSPTLESSIRPL